MQPTTLSSSRPSCLCCVVGSVGAPRAAGSSGLIADPSSVQSSERSGGGWGVDLRAMRPALDAISSPPHLHPLTGPTTRKNGWRQRKEGRQWQGMILATHTPGRRGASAARELVRDANRHVSRPIAANSNSTIQDSSATEFNTDGFR